MAQYLVSCRCGSQVVVSPSLAGSTVVCACGQSIDVPTLREMRDLPVESSEHGEGGSQWTVRHSMAAATIIVAVGLAIFAGYLFWQYRHLDGQIPRFVPEERAKIVEENIRQLTPARVWELWLGSYRPLAEVGFSEFPGAPELQRQVDSLRLAATTTLSISVACAVVGTVLLLIGKRQAS